MPPWLDDPFPKRRKPRRSLGPIGRDYLVVNAKAQRGKGGVYEAIDLSVAPPRAVIIKEGRRHGETDRDGKDARQRLRHEGKVLRHLRHAGLPVPEVFREFIQSENRYLVIEMIDARPLLTAKQLGPTPASWRRADKILRQLAPLLQQLHAAGWVWRDCHPSHLLLQRGQIWLIDFETACRPNERRISPWGSANYLPPGYRDKTYRSAGTLEDDYALGVLAFQAMCGDLPPPTFRRRFKFYRRSHCPSHLLDRIENLLRY
ncbi:MAG: phosphotransferase [Chthoniobacterales bacterium]|nr:phosphotransferase [Chthoniobacterales bacterium]